MSPYVAVDHTVCTGCKECEVVCSLHHFGECNPQRSAIRVLRWERRGLVDSLPRVCQQCDEAPCIDACADEAIQRKGSNGTVAVDPDACSGCGACTDACPAGCIFMDARRNVALNCDFCGGEPQCVALCHSHCLTVANAETGDDPNRVERLAAAFREIDARIAEPGRGE